VEVLVALVNRESPLCTCSYEMNESSSQKLIVCAKGFVVDFGRTSWRSWLDTIVTTIQAIVQSRIGETLDVVASMVCPECLRTFLPSKSAALNCSLARSASVSLVWCKNGHRVDICRVNGEMHEPVDARLGCLALMSFNEVPTELLRSVVIVGVKFADGSCKIGSGFVAVRDRFLLVTAAHTAKQTNHSPVVQCLVALMKDGSREVEFNMTAKIVVMGTSHVDACVLMITEGEPLPPNIQDLKLTCDSFVGQHVCLIGYNQGGEGVVESGTVVDGQPDALFGYVCKDSKIRTDDGICKELVIDGGRVIRGHSGGPCLNASGEVVGILSRHDTFDTHRWHIVPSNHLETLLQIARSRTTWRHTARTLGWGNRPRKRRSIKCKSH
jgi:S1-C subfamily serine protease